MSMVYGRIIVSRLKMDGSRQFKSERGPPQLSRAPYENTKRLDEKSNGVFPNCNIKIATDHYNTIGRGSLARHCDGVCAASASVDIDDIDGPVTSSNPSNRSGSGTASDTQPQANAIPKLGQPLESIASTGIVYLDYNATTPIWPQVVTAMQPYLEEFGNPSSAYWFGRKTKTALDIARAQVARLINARENEIFFCSCGTEADNWAIWGTVAKARARVPESLPHVITSAVEHPAVLQCLRRLKDAGLLEFTMVGVDKSGRVNVSDIKKEIKETTALITIMHSNNEVGTLQPVDQIAELARSSGIAFHSDAAQSIGKVKIDVSALKFDLLTIVGHKFGAPKGIAALYIRTGTEIENLLFGGGQESGHRGGTENVLLAVALGKAAEIAREEMEDAILHMRSLRDYLQNLLCDGLPDELVRVNGPHHDPSLRLPNTLSIGFRGVDAAQVLHDISDTVAASAGSACHSVDHSQSEASQTAVPTASVSSVLLAMEVPREYALGTLRLSVGRHTTKEDVQTAAKVILKAVRSRLKLHSS